MSLDAGRDGEGAVSGAMLIGALLVAVGMWHLRGPWRIAGFDKGLLPRLQWRMDRIEAITAFVAVCDASGFAPAARRLGRSPSAVTRLVAALEEQLGVRLLQRTTRAV